MNKGVILQVFIGVASLLFVQLVPVLASFLQTENNDGLFMVDKSKINKCNLNAVRCF